MNENEILARWLGWKIINHPDNPDYFDPSGKFHARFPDFRTSNEWAGAVLEKLGDSQISLDAALNPDGAVRWSHVDIEGEWTGNRETWRDAVVDAALDIIGRSSLGSATGDV